MQPLKELPDEYQVSRIIDFTKKRWAIGLINILALPLLFFFGPFFLLFAVFVRHEDFWNVLAVMDSPLLITIFVFLFLNIFCIVLHELIHGLLFWWFTRSRPKFGCNFWYAYAGAPNWYLPRNQHIIVGFTPLVVLTIVGMFLLFFVPASLVLVLVFVLTLNAVGSVGDLIGIFFELLEPYSSLVQDTGLNITIYRTKQ